MSEADVDKIISELPNLPRADPGRREGTHCYAYNRDNITLYNYEVLLYTGELIKCHSYILHGNAAYKSSLKFRLRNGFIFLVWALFIRGFDD